MEYCVAEKGDVCRHRQRYAILIRDLLFERHRTDSSQIYIRICTVIIFSLHYQNG